MPVRPASATSIDPNRCPLCGAPNQCAMETARASGVEQPPCWCTRVPFPPLLLAGVPEAAQGKACICPACAGTGATDVTNILPACENPPAKHRSE